MEKRLLVLASQFDTLQIAYYKILNSMWHITDLCVKGVQVGDFIDTAAAVSLAEIIGMSSRALVRGDSNGYGYSHGNNHIITYSSFAFLVGVGKIHIQLKNITYLALFALVRELTNK